MEMLLRGGKRDGIVILQSMREGKRMDAGYRDKDCHPGRNEAAEAGGSSPEIMRKKQNNNYLV